MDINASGELSIDQKKDYAKTLYLRDEFTQKQIAERVDVSEQSMCRWVNEGHWEAQRKSVTVTKGEQLALLYDIMDHLTHDLKTILETLDEPPEEGKPKANPDKIYDAIAKISKSIERLEKDAGIGEIIQAIIALTKFAQHEDLEAAKTIDHWGRLFIQDALKKVK